MNEYLNELNRHTRSISVSISLSILLMTSIFSSSADAGQQTHAATLPDLSGLAWIEDDLFLGIHDAKRNPEKYNTLNVRMASHRPSFAGPNYH